MYGYKIQKPKSLPKIVFACKTTVDQYEWKNSKKPNMIEFGVVNSKRLTYILDNCKPQIVEGEFFLCDIGSEKIRGFAEDGITVEIVCVAVEFEDLSYTKTDFDYEDITDDSVLFLPPCHQFFPSHEFTFIKNMLYKTIECYAKKSAASEIMCASHILSLMSELDRMVRQYTKLKKEKFTNYYVSKAESIILERYYEKITIKNISAELGITPNYLSSVFKASTGVSFSYRLLETRMKKAEELLKSSHLSTSEIATKVGYDDESHLRRRFKQYFGVSIHDYKLINKELTLYHQKPQRNTASIN